MKVTDPVCGMTFEASEAIARIEWAGRTYHFCSESCHRRCASRPESYVAPAPSKVSGRHQ